jgi:hypothetical protein
MGILLSWRLLGYMMWESYLLFGGNDKGEGEDKR